MTALPFRPATVADLPKIDFDGMRADVERAVRQCYPDRAGDLLRALDVATRSYRTTRWERRRERHELEMELRLESERYEARTTERAYRRAMRELARAVARPAKKPRRLGGRGPRP